MTTIDNIDHTSMEKEPIFPMKQRWMLLGASIVLTWALSVFSLFETFKIQELIQRTVDGDTGAAYTLMAMQQKGVDPLKAISFVVGVLAVVIACLWFYRASLNVHVAGMNYLTYTPGWNVGWFFIPIAHIFMPAIVVAETVKASQSINDRNEYSSWKGNSTGIWFKIWALSFSLKMAGVYFFTFYSMSFISGIAAQDPDALIGLMNATVLVSYIGFALNFIEGISLILFTKQITDLHEQYRAS
ncbi:MAG TPA: DUF4328 domain-containing protein [Flavobacteriales bacterium]|nr:DUF4328 domain-containing protein [Flavobacteriales bacterium]